MSLKNIMLSSGFAIGFNIFVHALGGVLFKDYQFNKKIQYTNLLLFIFGVLGIVIANLLDDDIIKNGLFYGGILLIMTVVIGNWDTIGNEGRLFISSSLMGMLIWYIYTRDAKIDKITKN